MNSSINPNPTKRKWDAEKLAKFKNILSTCHELKPDNLIIDNVKWRYLVRSILRGENTIILGPTGCGKTITVFALRDALKRQSAFFRFNMGSTQEPRSMLIGNAQYDSKDGTYFSDSEFVRAIQTPNALVFLDEISRSHPEACNILMPVLDSQQRCLRIDEKSYTGVKKDAEGNTYVVTKENNVIYVAEGVCFIATANIGNEYTGTRVMDRAFSDRFPAKVEMQPLDKEGEIDFLSQTFPEAESKMVNIFAEIAAYTRTQSMLNESPITISLSTRSTVEMVELHIDGFTLEEIAQLIIYPVYEDGGDDSERTHMKTFVQKFIDTGAPGKIVPPSPNDAAF